MELQDKLMGLEGIRDGVKQLLKNKFVIGGVAVGIGLELYKKAKTFNLTTTIQGLIPNWSAFANVQLLGIPIGSFTMKMLGLSIAGTLIAQIIKVGVEIKMNPEKATGIIIKEGVSFMILVIGLYLLGQLGIDMLNTSNAIGNMYRF